MSKAQYAPNFSSPRIVAWPLVLAALIPCGTLVWLLSLLPREEQGVWVKVIVIGALGLLFLALVFKFWVNIKRYSYERASKQPQAKPVAKTADPWAATPKKGQAEPWLRVVDGQDAPGKGKRHVLGK